MKRTYTREEDIIARPRQPLDDHLTKVVSNVKSLLSDTALGKDERFRTTAQTVAHLHDFGKLTQFFQQYIHLDDPRDPNNRDRYHSLVSAFVTAHALHSIDQDPDQPQIPDELQTAAFYAVAKHHQTLPNHDSEHPEYIEIPESGRRAQRYQRVRRQLRDIDTHTGDIADGILAEATNECLSWSDIAIDRLEEYRCLLIRQPPSKNFYSTVLELWSLLTCADKLNAAGMSAPAGSPVTLDARLIQDRIDELPDPDQDTVQSRLNKLRDKGRNTARDRLLRGHEYGESVYTLTLPTGFGKTFAGLEAALRLADEKGGRVIYALPYTSVIDQLNDEIQTVFNVESGSDAYTIHHHLADTRTSTTDVQLTDHPNTGDEVLYGETWLASLVLTTFVQLFESAAGPANTQSIKLPALQDSVIVLDEPQAISIEWWHLICRLTSILVEDYNATVIFMTATQPRIISNISAELDPTPLIDDRSPYLSFLENNPRVDYRFDDSLIEYLERRAGGAPRPPSAAASRIITDATSTPDRETLLAICNTVRSATALSQRLADQLTADDISSTYLGDELLAFYDDTNWLRRIYEEMTSLPYTSESDPSSDDDYSASIVDQAADAYLSYLDTATDAGEYLLATLTTRLRPIDRMVLIACLRRLLDTEQETPFDDTSLIVTATQLVEAGVDVSFDRLYRDFAPLPSLVQAAGRCNRSYDGNHGEVLLWRLAAEDDEIPPSMKVYGLDRDLLAPTRQALRRIQPTTGAESGSIPEYLMISRAVDEYYEAVHSQERSGEREDDLVSKVDRACGEDLRTASLIEQDYETTEILIPLELEQEILTQYHELRDERDFEAADASLSALKQALVTIPVTKRTRPVLEGLDIDDEGTFQVLQSTTEYTIQHGVGIMPTALPE